MLIIHRHLLWFDLACLYLLWSLFASIVRVLFTFGMSDYSLNVAFALFTFGVIDYCVSVALVLFTFGSSFAQQWMYLLKRAVTSNDVSSNFSFFFISRASIGQLFVPVATGCLDSLSTLGIELLCDSKSKCECFWMNRKSPTFITLLLLSLICPHYIYLWICFETDKICSLLHISVEKLRKKILECHSCSNNIFFWKQRDPKYSNSCG